jgi:hypothetical protein
LRQLSGLGNRCKDECGLDGARNMAGITCEQLAAMVAIAKKSEMVPYVVSTPKQAKAMRAGDPVGHQWKVGEKYFEYRFSAGVGYVLTGDDMQTSAQTNAAAFDCIEATRRLK